MKLRSLEIKNFRQFYGQHFIEFSIDENKNVTLIHAENGAGKTALLNSIRWCLHESFTSNFPDSDKLINNKWKEKGHNDFSVRLEFEEEGEVYATTRGVDSNGNKYLLVYKAGVNGQFEAISQDKNLFINSIIPKEMANYFFFQGEGFGRLANLGSNKGVKQAIHEILGFSLAQQAIKDLNDIVRDQVREIAKIDTSNKLQDKKRAYETCIKRIDELEERINYKQEEVNLYKNKIEKINDTLSKSNHAVIREKQKQRSDYEKRLSQAESRLNISTNYKLEFIRDYGNAVFAHNLTLNALDFIDENELKGTVPAPYNKQLIQDILDQKHCICGASVTIGTEAYSSIVSMLEKAGDPVLNSRVNRARAQLSELRRNSAKSSNKYLEVLSFEKQAKDEVAELKTLINNLSKEIINQNYSDAEISALEKNRRDHQDFLDRSNRELGQASSQIKEQRTVKSNLEDEITRLQGNLPQVEILNKAVEIAKKIIQIITNKLDNFEKEMPTILIGKINKFLTQFVRQDFKAKINPDTYNIALYDESDRKVAMSDGQSLLLSLTFISSLIELARERKNLKDEILTPGAIAPFVIDAPFGDLDNTYKANVAHTIPKTVDQVVFLLSSSHWAGLVDDAIRDRVGSEYTLQVEVEGPQGDKKIDSITINGKDYPSAVYEKEISRTNIIKVM